MCGRFMVDDGVWTEVERLIGWLDHSRLKRGDMFPGQQILILKGREGADNGLAAGGRALPEEESHGGIALCGCMARWGYPGRAGGRPLINARAETVQEKPTFRADFAKRRCVIPARGFYEWNSKKEKFFFSEGAAALYLAGIYGSDPQGECVTILTIRANESVEPVHERMPLLVPAGKISDWIKRTDRAVGLLGKEPPALKRERVHDGYEQLSLFS